MLHKRPLPYFLRLLRSIYAPLCVSCGSHIGSSSFLLCPDCEASICYLPVQEWPTQSLAIARLNDLPMHVPCSSFLSFSSPITQKLLHAAKYGSNTLVIKELTFGYVDILRNAGVLKGVDILLPVPISQKRLRQRGFNQSILIAEYLSRVTKIPLLVHVLKKVRHTEPQASQNFEKRRKNVEGAFAIPEKYAPLLSNKHILLVDDVLTTGATVSEIVRLINKLASDATLSVATLASTHHYQ